MYVSTKFTYSLERFKLFCLRIKKSVSESFLGSDLDYLLSV